jgi:plasmid stabilization system protein ParE
MKQYSLIIHPFAESDLKIAADWYYLQKEGLDQRFIEEIEKTIVRIKLNPRQFSFVRKKTRMSIVKRFPYGLYFYVRDAILNVFAVFHFSRNPKVWRKRLR